MGGIDLRCGGGRVAALRRSRRLIHFRSRSIPDPTPKERAPRMGALSFGGDGGNRTPVRKRFDRNFSGRRRSFAFPCPSADRHAQGLGSFMMHGTLKALRTHVHHLSTPRPGPWSSRAGRSLLRQRGEQRYRRSLIYKLPILWMVGASARYSCLHTPVETSTSPGLSAAPRPAARRSDPEKPGAVLRIPGGGNLIAPLGMTFSYLTP